MADQWKISAAMVAESEERSYELKVHGYSRAKELFRNSDYLVSPPFSVGGHSFVLRYYPNGDSAESAGFVSFVLVPDSDEAMDVKVKARLSVPGMGGLPVPPYRLFPDYIFGGDLYQKNIFGGDDLSFGCDIHHMALERSWGIIMDDCLSIRCDVTVEKDIHGEEAIGDRFLVVPPSDLHMHFGDLLESMFGADVTFHVGGEKFFAHRSVLAARSSVFRAELLGAMNENDGSPIVIDEMEARVFKCLLHFIYTDSLPALEMAMASHLLVAADRYGIERLKLICEHKLCSNIDTEMVATSLVLADQHGCTGLKEACFQFLASPSNLEAMMASDGYEHLNISCPSVLKELIASLLPATMKAAKDIVMNF